jgi:phytoene/squalene synthetase
MDSLVDGAANPGLLNSIQNFIERSLLPAINAQPTSDAYNMAASLQFIIEVLRFCISFYCSINFLFICFPAFYVFESA